LLESQAAQVSGPWVQRRTSAPTSIGSSNVITRALGGHEDIDLDQRSFEVRPRDRFLLCSDGLYRELSADTLQSQLGAGDPAAVVTALLERTLRGAASDNVTAVVVEATPGAD